MFEKSEFWIVLAVLIAGYALKTTVFGILFYLVLIGALILNQSQSSFTFLMIFSVLFLILNCIRNSEKKRASKQEFEKGERYSVGVISISD